jgi:DNA-binding NtrC family response regulator
LIFRRLSHYREGIAATHRALFSELKALARVAEILLVDDDRALLDALSKALRLRLRDVEIDTCSTAGHALERILQTDYDVIISDLKMPGIEGLALLGLVRKLRPETPFILITGDHQRASATSAQVTGAFQVLPKPVDRDTLIQVVQRALLGRAPQHKARQIPHRQTRSKAIKTV